MALISSKNLVAPLTNKIHITTIILVAMVFAVFRLAGGGVDVKSALRSKLAEDKQKLLAISPSKNEASTQNNNVLDILNKPKEDAQVKDIQNNRIVPPWERNKAQQQPQQQGTNNQEATSLDDIKRMLGNR